MSFKPGVDGESVDGEMMNWFVRNEMRLMRHMRNGYCDGIGQR